jgi:polyisoprenoid-binding protein YceI
MATQEATKTKSIWKIDPAHTNVQFSAKHMMISTVKGQFKQVIAEVDWDEQDVTKSSVVATIDASSLVTGVDMRDNHLRSADFLHAEQYPAITFKSTRIEPVGDSEYKVYGDLTIRGTTKPVVLDTTYEGRGNDPYGNEHAGFTAKTTINRKDWGLEWNVALETGGMLVGDTVKIELEVELVKVADTEPAAQPA